MQVDCQIYCDGYYLVVELPFTNVYYDLQEVQRKAYRYFGGFGYEMYEGVDSEDHFVIHFKYLNSDEKYDLLHDLTYYHNVKPVMVTMQNQEDKKILYEIK